MRWQIALEHDLTEGAATCYFLLSDRCFRRDRYAEALGYLDEALALAKRMGSRPYEWAVLAERTYPLFMAGSWDDVLSTTDGFTQEQVDAGGVVLSVLQSGVGVHVERGELDEARRIFSLFSRLESSSDVQDRATYLAATATLRRAEGRFEEALAAGAATIDTVPTLGAGFQGVKNGITDALEAALALGDSARAQELLAFIDELTRERGRSSSRRRRTGSAADRATRVGRSGGSGAHLSRDRHAVLARGDPPGARGADGERDLAHRGARDFRATRRSSALARESGCDHTWRPVTSFRLSQEVRRRYGETSAEKLPDDQQIQPGDGDASWAGRREPDDTIA